MDGGARIRDEDLIDIPLIDVGGTGPSTLLDAEPGRLAAVISVARRHYGGLALRMGDSATRQWLTRNGNSYAGEIADIARRVGLPGAYLLNLSYEWSCTSELYPESSAIWFDHVAEYSPGHGWREDVGIAASAMPSRL